MRTCYTQYETAKVVNMDKIKKTKYLIWRKQKELGLIINSCGKIVIIAKNNKLYTQYETTKSSY